MQKFNAKEIQKIVDSGNCMSCGLCSVDLDNKKKNENISVEFSEKHDYFVPNIKNHDDNYKSPCPGQSLDMNQLSMEKYGNIPKDYLLGNFKSLNVSYASSAQTRKAAASGGIITTTLKHLFSTDQIDLAYVLDPGSTPYESKGIVIDKNFDLEQLHGSVYHPTNFGYSLDKLLGAEGRFAFVGLPCHIHTLETIKNAIPEVKERHVLSIGLFCGGVNTFKGISYYLEAYKFHIDKIKNIKYRIGDWPGKIGLTFKDNDSQTLLPRIRGNSRFKILRYVVAFQGYWMLKRCRLCPDQVNDFADIAVGDPHLPELRKRKETGFSIAVARSDKGQEIIEQLQEHDLITCEDISRDNVVHSQGYTLNNRKHLKSYLKINSLFGGKNPEFSLYEETYKNLTMFNYIYATVDLFKVYMPKNGFIRLMYIPWQIFEYLFITLTPSIIFKRIFKVFKNK